MIGMVGTCSFKPPFVAASNAISKRKDDTFIKMTYTIMIMTVHSSIDVEMGVKKGMILLINITSKVGLCMVSPLCKSMVK
jgi:hypothetical protein